MAELPAALILAGGAGTRLGGVDKAFVVLKGVSLVDRVVARLAPQAARIAIGANGDPARFAYLRLPVLADGGFAGKGPLAGVAAGLAWARKIGAPSLLTIPVDTPFFPEDFAKSLTPAPAVAVYLGRQHHLAAHWPVSFLPALADFLARPGRYKVRDALALCGARPVIFEAAADPFLNINTPDDLAAVQPDA